MDRLLINGGLKRRVLVVDDEMINRELLGAVLSDSYETIFASNGKEAMAALTEPDSNFSLILLDLLMPVMDGFEVIERCRADKKLRRIPIIVMTAEKSAEVRSIRMGAADFITKPYDLPEVILARCERIIELSEDKSIIRSTERDELSGLYTREFFFALLQGFLPRLESPMDALVLNIDHFNMINELYGRKEGDTVLKTAGELIGEALEVSHGIACRSEGDIFLIFIERKNDYDPMIEQIREKLAAKTRARNIRLRAGIYSCEKGVSEPKNWFSRAKAACDSIRGRFGTMTVRYDKEMFERALYNERLVGDLQDALDNHDLVVYYQPKYRIHGARPELTSAEALVRWNHPELGFISPGEFIPLFESNGLIRRVDNYVWREAAAQVRRWCDRYGVKFPVSVNVSRVDIFDPELKIKLLNALKAFSLEPSDILLEITESAYADNADRLINVVNELHDEGFRIEMDDFGSGYSSLNMLTAIPIDVLKLDMQFIRRMLHDQKSRRMVELVMDIAGCLGVAVIAEGVEEEKQLITLKEMGCDIVQGFYFSPPLPAEKFGELIEKEYAD